jgi:hypothetical protein
MPASSIAGSVIAKVADWRTPMEKPVARLAVTPA